MARSPDNLPFATIGDQLDDAVVVADAEGRIRWTNPAFHKLCGYTVKEVRGRKPGDFLQGEETDSGTAAALREAVRGGLALKTEILNYHKNGTPYWASISLNPIRDNDGGLLGFVAVERDRTLQRSEIVSMERQIVEVYSALLREVREAEGDGNTGAPGP